METMGIPVRDPEEAGSIETLVVAGFGCIRTIVS